MDYIVAAFVCIFLFIVKGGLPGPVCFALFVGYCVWKISSESKRNAQIREARKDKHLAESAAEFHEKVQEEAKLLSEKGISLDKCFEDAKSFPYVIKDELERNNQLIAIIENSSDQNEIKMINQKIRESNSRIDNIIHDAKFGLEIVEGSKRFYKHYLDKDLSGNYVFRPTSRIREMFEYALSDDKYQLYISNRAKWEEKYGR